MILPRTGCGNSISNKMREIMPMSKGPSGAVPDVQSRNEKLPQRKSSGNFRMKDLSNHLSDDTPGFIYLESIVPFDFPYERVSGGSYDL